jgi:hypothetical protein
MSQQATPKPKTCLACFCTITKEATCRPLTQQPHFRFDTRVAGSSQMTRFQVPDSSLELLLFGF